MKIYLVGGAVRDTLLGLPVKERDWVVVGATPEQMLDLGYKLVGKSFPVFLHPETHEEYALARTEKKVGPGYTGFEVCADPTVSLEDDLRRRDLTINAIAEDDQGRLIDPFGGQEDLSNVRLRHVSPAFVEDPVRILRIARFASKFGGLGFRVAHETNKLMREMVSNGEIDALVPERVWQETEKALAETSPRRFLEVLRACGALAKIFPEVDELFGVPQVKKHHPEVDAGIHTLLALDQAALISQDPRVRFAVLVHDLGKAKTPPAELPKHIGHEHRGVTLVENLSKRLRLPNDYRELGVLVAKYHLHCMRVQEMRAATILKTLEALDAFRRPERFELFLHACEADFRGRKGSEQKPFVQAVLFRQLRNAAANIDTGFIQASDLSGKEAAEVLRKKRIDAITSALA